MKKIVLVVILFVTLSSSAQLGIGTTSPAASSILDISSTDKGLLLPRMTNSQKNSIATPAAGLWIWCSDCGVLGEMQVYNGVSWTTLSNDSYPSGLSYPSSPFIFTRDTPIATITPLNLGNPIVSYSISPTLPIGLSFNTATGEITGTPTTIQSATNYTITATNTGGSTTATLSITINDIAPSALTYSGSPFVFYKDAVTTSGIPTNSGGTLTSYSISPALPIGLSFNTATGEITGTPTTIQSATNYTITATNTGGSTTATISIAINDIVHNASLVYSLRKLKSSYSGPAIRVRRSSDNTEQDISFDASGNLNQTSLLSFVGSNNGFVTTWYDQSESGINLTQSTASSQPQIVDTGVVIVQNSKPALKSTVSANTSLASSSASFTFGSIHIVGQSNSVPSTGNYQAFFQQAGGISFARYFNDGNTLLGRLEFGAHNTPVINTINTISPQTPTNLAIYSSVFNEGKAYKNRVVIATDIASTPISSSNTFTVFNNPGLSMPLDGTMSEFIVYSSGLSTFQREALESNQGVYYLLAPQISYTVPSSYTKGTAISALLPQSTGAIVNSYSISPLLPTGLTFNTTTGEISGTPSDISNTTIYSVTATNDFSSSTATISITVNDIPPTALTYSGSPFTFAIYSTITPLSPTNAGGTVVSYSISPALPAGLTFNTATGTITGTPTVVFPSTIYTITATNTGGSTTATLSITINDIAPSGLTYSGSPFVFYKNNLITPISAPTNSGGTVVSYTISPSLPSGLSLNTVTGVISGTPTTIQSATTHTITATNTGGSTTTTINISVVLNSLDKLGFSASDPKATVAYSLRRLSTDYTGSAIRVTKDNSTFQDIGFDGSGNLDETALTTFASGATVYVSTWYDQSGNGNNATQSTLAYLPRIVNAGVIESLNGKPAVFLNVNFLTTSISSSIAYPNTINGVFGSKTSNATGTFLAFGENNGPGFGLGNNLQTTASNYNITGIKGGVTYMPSSTALAPNSTAVITMNTLSGGGATTLSLNKSALTIASANAAPLTSSSRVNIGSNASSVGSTTNITNSYVQEGIFINSTLSASLLQVLENNQGAYYSVAPVISYSSPSAYTKGTAITALSPVSTGGAAAYTVSPTLPAGLSLNTTTGNITGTPTVVAAATTYTVTATNGFGSSTATLSLTVNDIVPVISYTNSNLLVNTSATITPTVNGISSATYSISPTLPTGLSINASTGVISGTPTQATSATTYTISATNSAGIGTATVVISINAAGSINYPQSAYTFVNNTSVSGVVPVVSTTSTTTFSISPSLPTGLSFNTSTGAITGTPTAVSATTLYTISGDNAQGNFSTTITIDVKNFNLDKVGFNTTDPKATAAYSLRQLSTDYTGAAIQVTKDNLTFQNIGFDGSGNLNETALTTFAAGGTVYVRTWYDQSGNGNDATQSTLVKMPRIVNSGAIDKVNGKPYVYFNSKNLVSPNITALSGSNATVTMSGVLNPLANSGYAQFWATGSVNAAYNGFDVSFNVSGTNLYVGSSSVSGSAGGSSISLFIPHTISGIYSGTGATAYLDGVQSTGSSVSFSYASTGNVNIGGARSNASLFNGYIPELIVFSSALTTQRATLESNQGTYYSLAPVISYTSPSAYTKGTAITALSPVSTGGEAAYTVSPALPAGLSLNTTTGNITGTPTVVAAATTYTVTATNTFGSSTATLSIIVNDIVPVISYTNANLLVNTSATITPTVNGISSATFSISPTLPTGLSINDSTGVISGTPTQATSATTYTISATNTVGTGTATVVISTNAEIVINYPQSAYTFFNNLSVSGVVPVVSPTSTVTFSISPSLPTGLSFNTSSGAITGTPTAVSAATTYTVTATTNSNGNTSTTINITVDDDIVQDRYFGQTINGANNHNFRYKLVVAADGKIWLNNNLGAHYANVDHASYNPAQQASSATDYLAYGSLFQWGRKADGHELIIWSNSTTPNAINGTTGTLTNTPADPLFIVVPNSPSDWRTTQDNTLWDTEASANNPCPVGFRVPTAAELTNLVTTSSITNKTTAASSTLKFTAPGVRYYSNGQYFNVTVNGYYWTSSVSGTFAINRDFNSGTFNDTNRRSNGLPVRCIKN